MSSQQAVLSPRAPASADVERSAAVDRGPRLRLRARLSRFAHMPLVWSVGTAFAMFSLTAVQGVLLARMLGPHVRGEYGTAIFYTQLLTFVGLLGTQLSIARRAARGQDGLGELARSAMWLGCITGLGTLAVVSVLAAVGLPPEKRYLAPMCIACALFLPLEHVRLSLLAIDHGTGRFTRYNAHRLLAVFAMPAMLSVAWLAGYGSLTLVVALSVLAPLGPLVLRLATGDHSIFGPIWPGPLALIKEGVPNAVALFASDLLNRLDVFLVVLLAPFATQGLYAAAVPAASLLIVAPNTMALFAFNTGARHERAMRLGRLMSTVAAVTAFQAACGLAFAFVIGPLLTLVYGEAFAGAVPFALALLPAQTLNGCALVAEGYLQGRGQPQVGVWCRLCGAAAMLTFVWLFLGRFGAMSIPLGATAGQTVNALCVLWAVVNLAGSETAAV